MGPIDQDIIVIGAGMAGCSIAAHLAQERTVTVLEMEAQPGYHSTGRSAALFSEIYGNPAIRALSRASRPFFEAPPEGFSTTPLLHQRDVLIVAREGQRTSLQHFLDHELVDGALERIDIEHALQLCPVLRRDGLIGVILYRGAADIDVHALHQGYLRLLKQRGSRLVVNAPASNIRRDGKLWIVDTPQGTFRAKILVNAAGAWAEHIGQMGGAQQIHLQPLRRTAALIDPPVGLAVAAWPMLLDVDEGFYLKPDAGALLLSPADETLDRPCDVQPEDIDIAIAADRLQAATTITVTRIRSKWAGLRSFVADRSPVVGYDTRQNGFFWHAALGGYGIQTAPALSRLAADLVLGKTNNTLTDMGFSLRDISPMRFGTPDDQPSVSHQQLSELDIF